MAKIISQAKLNISGVSITNEAYEFEWRYQDKEDNNPSFLEINLPNLSKEFNGSIIKGASAIFDFGFDNVIGTFVNGIVDKKTINYFDDVTEITTLKILEIDANGFQDISKSYKNKKTSYIIRDIANEMGYIIKTLEIKNDVLMQSGYVAYGKGLNIIKKLAEQANSNIRVEGNSLYVYDSTIESKDSIALIKFGTGLLQFPTEIEEESKNYTHTIKCLANPDIRKNSIIKVETDNLNSFCKVLELDINNWVATYFIQVMEV